MNDSDDSSRLWTLFLDFDGVLNNEPFLRHQRNHPPSDGPLLFDPENIRALNKLCDELPVSAIVISSSWRTNRELDALRLLLVREGFTTPGLIDGVTGAVAVSAEGRAKEIESYVDDQDLGDWFALDDFDLSPFMASKVLRIRASTGLTSQTVDEIMAALSTAPRMKRASKIERLACEQLCTVLDTTDLECPDYDSPEFAALLQTLEYFVHDILKEYSSTWFGDETIDGIIGYLCERKGPRGLCVVGLCWLMSSQGDRTVPVSIEVHADESFSFFEKVVCCLDEAGQENPTKSIWPKGFEWATWELRYRSQPIRWLHTAERSKPLVLLDTKNTRD